jgi:hypothetical protein
LSPDRNEAVALPVGVRDIIHNSVPTRRGGLRFGFVLPWSFCFGHWFLQNRGRGEWLVGLSEPPVKQPHDPEFYDNKSTDIAELLLTKPIDVFISFDAVPGYNHPAWSSRTTKAVVWVSSKNCEKGLDFQEVGKFRLPRLHTTRSVESLPAIIGSESEFGWTKPG